jgi:hypothetical protein
MHSYFTVISFLFTEQLWKLFGASFHNCVYPWTHGSVPLQVGRSRNANKNLPWDSLQQRHSRSVKVTLLLTQLKIPMGISFRHSRKYQFRSRTRKICYNDLGGGVRVLISYMTLKTNVQLEFFWVLTVCSIVVGYQHFEGACTLHLVST